MVAVGALTGASTAATAATGASYGFYFSFIAPQVLLGLALGSLGEASAVFHTAAIAAGAVAAVLAVSLGVVARGGAALPSAVMLAIYGADLVVAALVGDWLTAAAHAFALAIMTMGYVAIDAARAEREAERRAVRLSGGSLSSDEALPEAHLLKNLPRLGRPPQILEPLGDGSLSPVIIPSKLGDEEVPTIRGMLPQQELPVPPISSSRPPPRRGT